jgi:uncharacterized coiled-coil protein SlyX
MCQPELDAQQGATLALLNARIAQLQLECDQANENSIMHQRNSDQGLNTLASEMDGIYRRHDKHDARHEKQDARADRIRASVYKAQTTADKAMAKVRAMNTHVEALDDANADDISAVVATAGENQYKIAEMTKFFEGYREQLETKLQEMENKQAMMLQVNHDLMEALAQCGRPDLTYSKYRAVYYRLLNGLMYDVPYFLSEHRARQERRWVTALAAAQSYGPTDAPRAPRPSSPPRSPSLSLVDLHMMQPQPSGGLDMPPLVDNRMAAPPGMDDMVMPPFLELPAPMELPEPAAPPSSPVAVKMEVVEPLSA